MGSWELFIQEDELTAEGWRRFEEKIREYDKRFILEIVFESNLVRFYLYSSKNLSKIFTKLEGFLLEPVENWLLQTSPLGKKISFRLPSHKNILEVKEKEEIKKERIIKRIVIFRSEFLFQRFYQVCLFLSDKKGNNFYSSYLTLSNPLINLEVDFKKSPKVKKKSTPGFLKIDEANKLFVSDEKQTILEVFAFPYFSSSLYFPLTNFDFDKHTLIVGQTGVGKSKFIELFVKKLAESGLTDDYRVVIIDPHAGLYNQFLGLANVVNFDYVRSACDLFPSLSEPKIATELTILLFKTLLKDQFNAKMERVLKYVVYILFLKNQMSLANLKQFLTGLEFRNKILAEVGEKDEFLVHFFETEFIEMQTKFYELAVMPLLVLVDELSFIPAFSKESPYNLESILEKNFLTFFSLNRIFLGEKATRLIAGLLIQQIFLIAQKRTLNKKIILIIDEVSLVENESLISILSEARKFNLSLFLSQQYLTQITPDLLKAVLSNVFNYFAFKVSDEDAKILSKNLEMKFPDELLIKGKEKGLSEEDLKLNLLVALNPRECLVRPFFEGKFYPCFKAKTLNV